LEVSEIAPEIVVREALPSDLEAFWRVVGTIYNDGQPYPEERWTSEGRRHFIAYVDGVAAGGFNILDMEIARGLATLKNGGVAMVATLPEFRGSGVGGAMMSFAVQLMRNENYSLAALYGFAERYYRRFGYETAGGKLKISVPLASMPRPKGGGLAVRQVHCYDEILPCYENYARARSGMAIRDAFWWQRAVGDMMIYACGEPVEAYFAIRYRSGFHDQLEINEFFWNSQRGYETMLSFMSDLGANRGSVVWREGLDSPFLYKHLPRTSQLQITLDGPAMFRAVTIETALTALRPASKGEFSLKILDPVCPENEGPWTVDFSPEGVRVSPAKEADLTLSIQAFTQALLGHPSLEDLIRNDMVEVTDAVRAESAIQLLPPMPVGLYDFF
jgi:predicted acetyltransferase